MPFLVQLFTSGQGAEHGTVSESERSDTSGAGLAFFFSEETGSKASTFATISLRPDLHVVVAKQQEQEGRKFMFPPPFRVVFVKYKQRQVKRPRIAPAFQTTTTSLLLVSARCYFLHRKDAPSP